MAIKKQNPLRVIGRQIHAILPLHPLHSPETLNGARIVESFDNLPEVYHDFFKPHLSRGQAFPYTVITPTYEVSGEMVTGNLLCAIGHVFYVLEEIENTVTKTCYPIP